MDCLVIFQSAFSGISGEGGSLEERGEGEGEWGEEVGNDGG